MWIRQPSNMISKILSPAVQLWLRSQVDRIETLQMKIQGSDRQILGGYIPGILLNSKGAVYQGLHLGEADITGENIRINIGQVIKGKPLELLEAIQVLGEVKLTEENLQASLVSPLLADAFRELLIALLEYQGIHDPQPILDRYNITWQGATLNQSTFTLQGSWTENEVSTPIIITAKIELISSQTLRLIPLKMEGIPEFNGNSLDELELDLGSDVIIDSLNLGDNQLFCRAQLLIRP